MHGTQTQVNMAYYKKSQKKVNGKWYPQGVTIGKPVQTKEVANRLADLSALSRRLLLDVGKSRQGIG